MKKFLGSLFTILLCGIIIYYKKPIANYLYKNFIFKKEIIVPDVTSYKKDYDFMYVQNTDNFYPKNKEEVLNVLYTILNSGWTEFSFYCDDAYEECNDDINEIAKDNSILGQINNFVHPYNTYESISLSINNFNKVTVEVKHLYSTSDILAIDKQIETIYNENIDSSMSDYEKIKKIHDYIINNTKYDQEKEKDIGDSTKYKYKSNMAYGPLINGIALCGGYADAMALFLEKMGIKNYRIASENHIWNLVYINGEWKHLDLTWDDPVYEEDLLTYNFFLINTTTLKNLDSASHIYDTSIYLEAN
jgi:hypothetical protein